MLLNLPPFGFVLFQGHSLAPVSFWYPPSGKMHVWLWLHAVVAAHMIASGLLAYSRSSTSLVQLGSVRLDHRRGNGFVSVQSGHRVGPIRTINVYLLLAKQATFPQLVKGSYPCGSLAPRALSRYAWWMRGTFGILVLCTGVSSPPA